MMPSPEQPTIMIIGNDTTINYLIGRYAQQSNYHMVMMPAIPQGLEIRTQLPAVILFTSIERLLAAQQLVEELVNDDIPLIVCCSRVDETQARELGADYCLLHPLTYEQFLATLKMIDLHKRG
jgi:DNA-binding response OmpR family regulator